MIHCIIYYGWYISYLTPNGNGTFITRHMVDRSAVDFLNQLGLVEYVNYREGGRFNVFKFTNKALEYMEMGE